MIYLRTEVEPVSVPLEPEYDDFEGTLEVGLESSEYARSEIEFGLTLKILLLLIYLFDPVFLLFTMHPS